MTVLATSAHRSFLKKGENFISFSLACTQLNEVANFHSNNPLCCSVPFTVYLQPFLLFAQLFEGFTFTIFTTNVPYRNNMLLLMLIISSLNLDYLKKKLKALSVWFYITRSHCILLPILPVEGELISMKSLLPLIIECGTAILLTWAFLAFSRLQVLQASNVPINWIPIAFLMATVISSKGCHSSVCNALIFFSFASLTF